MSAKALRRVTNKFKHDPDVTSAVSVPWGTYFDSLAEMKAAFDEYK